MFNFPLRRLLRKQTPAQPTDASNFLAPIAHPDIIGHAVQSLLANFADILVKLDRIEAKIDLLPPVSMHIGPYLDAAAIRQ